MFDSELPGNRRTKSPNKVLIKAAMACVILLEQLLFEFRDTQHTFENESNLPDAVVETKEWSAGGGGGGGADRGGAVVGDVKCVVEEQRLTEVLGCEWLYTLFLPCPYLLPAAAAAPPHHATHFFCNSSTTPSTLPLLLSPFFLPPPPLSCRSHDSTLCQCVCPPIYTFWVWLLVYLETGCLWCIIIWLTCVLRW